MNLETIQNIVIGNGRKMKLLKDWDGWITGCEPGGNTEYCHGFWGKSEFVPGGGGIMRKNETCCGSLFVLGYWMAAFWCESTQVFALKEAAVAAA